MSNMQKFFVKVIIMIAAFIAVAVSRVERHQLPFDAERQIRNFRRFSRRHRRRLPVVPAELFGVEERFSGLDDDGDADRLHFPLVTKPRQSGNPLRNRRNYLLDVAEDFRPKMVGRDFDHFHGGGWEGGTCKQKRRKRRNKEAKKKK